MCAYYYLILYVLDNSALERPSKIAKETYLNYALQTKCSYFCYYSGPLKLLNVYFLCDCGFVCLCLHENTYMYVC